MTGTELIAISDSALPVPLMHPPERAGSPYWVYVARFSGDDSARTMRGCLDRIAIMTSAALEAEPHPGELIPWGEMRYAHVVRIRSLLLERGWSPSHVNKHLSAIRGVLKEAWRLQKMTAEDFQRACDVKNIKARRQLAGRNIRGDETRRMLAACVADEGPGGIRDAAIVAVLQSTGARRAEVGGVLIERYDPGERDLQVIGKGNKERTVHIHPGAVPYLDRWLAILGVRRGPMFRRVDQWGHIGEKPLSPRAVGMIIDRRRIQAGLPPTSTHDYRRTFIGDFIDAGGDLIQAQQLAGHASATTTAQYDRRPARGRRAAVDRLTLPPLEDLRGTDT